MTTAEGVWLLEIADAVGLSSPEPGVAGPVLAGTTYIPDVSLTGAADEADWDACTSLAVDRGATGGADAVTFTEAGVTHLTVEPADCPVASVEARPDFVDVEVVEAASVEARFDFDLERAVEQGVADGTVEAAYPADWRPADGEPLALATGATGYLHPRVFLTDTDTSVGWALTGVTVTYTDAEGAVSTVEIVNLPDTFDGLVVADFPAGTELDAALVLPAATLPLGALTLVDPATIASVEIVAGYAVDPETGLRQPLGARAVSRDAAGAVIYGAAVEWTFEGPIEVGAAGGNLSPEYAGLTPGCVEELVDYAATLTATVNGISASAPVTWSVGAPSVCAAPEVVTEDKAGECGCDAGGAMTGLFGMLAALAAGVRRRG